MKEKKIVTCIGLGFDVNKPINTLEIVLPEHLQILSVKTKDNKPNMWINYMATEESFRLNKPWSKLRFLIVKCSNTIIEMDDGMNYIGTLEVKDKMFAVFYKIL